MNVPFRIVSPSFDRLYPSSRCPECPLFARLPYHVPGTRVAGAKIAIVGEAPGEYEAKEKRGFVGPSGKFLNKMLKHAGIKREEVIVSNALHCWPSNNNKLPVDLPLALTCCREILDADIAEAKVIVGLGNVPLRAFTGLDKISVRRGSVYSLANGRPFVPSLHPAFLMRSAHAKERVVPQEIVIADLKKARRIAEGEEWRVVENFTFALTVADEQRFLERLYAPEAFVTLDIETTKARPKDAELLTIAFTLPDGWTICMEFEGNEAFIAKALRSPTPKGTHGGIFDICVLTANAYEVVAWEYDTLYMFQTHYGELPQSLGFVASLCTMMPYWKNMRSVLEDMWNK